MAGGQHQLYAHTPRGQMYWQVMPAAPSVGQWQAFLQALIQQIPEKIFAVLANSYLARPEVLGTWLDVRTERFEAIYVPANATPAPALRRATPESRSQERRVGKALDNTCKSRLFPYTEKKKSTIKNISITK